jgi:tetratricopeptide (TPR) repeat protein
MRSRINILFLVIFFLGQFSVTAQDTDEQLANFYYGNGDCEKALPYIEKVYQRNPSKFMFLRYLECSRQLTGDKEVIKLLKNQIKSFPQEYEYQVTLGTEYENQGDQKNADKTFLSIIDNMLPYSSDIIKVQKAFSALGKSELALQALERGRKIIQGNYPLNIQFAEVYGELGRIEEMIDEYLGLIDYQSSMISTVQRIMPRMVEFEDAESKSFNYLKNGLLRRIQKDPNNVAYAEMLIWMFVQNKNFDAALTQAKALDKRTTKDGREVFELGRLAAANKDFSAARNAFKYLVEAGNAYPYYYSAESALLNTRYLEITTNRNYSSEELQETITEYEAALARIGEKATALPILKEVAHIMAFYANQPEKAKGLLEKGTLYRGATDIMKAELKSALADVLVILNDVWEASLLYMQVEKEFKYEPIGFEAKFKNARIFYYSGDFIWAQSQLDVLKSSTSKLIANDAMKLSVFITSHLGLDSNYTVMKKFAAADLLLEQHRYNEAFLVFDSIQRQFPYHGIVGDVLLRKGLAYEQQGKWDQAIVYYEEILKKFGAEILADDAAFHLGNIYENHLVDKKKAKEYYFLILKEYKDSLYTTEARKRFRALEEVL